MHIEESLYLLIQIKMMLSCFLYFGYRINIKEERGNETE